MARRIFSARKKRNRVWKKVFLFIMFCILGAGYVAYTLFEDSNDTQAGGSKPNLFPSPQGEVVKPRPIDRNGQSVSLPKDAHWIALVLTDFGVNPEFSQRALDQLPPQISFAISPFTQDAGIWASKARRNSHEILVNVPMEPDNFPASDPGPQTLLAALSKQENLKRLAFHIRQVPMAVGITQTSGTFFTTHEGGLRPIVAELRAKGMMFLDTPMTPYSLVSKLCREQGTSFLLANSFFGEHPEFMDQELRKIQLHAKQKGYAVAVLPLSPFVLQHLKNWIVTLPKDVVLAPLTAVMKATYHDAPYE